MNKWVNLYVIFLLINLFYLIIFNLNIFFSGILLLLAGIVLYLSNKNNTTSIVHIVMVGVAIIMFVLSVQGI